MLNRLNEALLECQKERIAIETRDEEELIRAELEAYEKQLRENCEKRRVEDLLDNEYQIKALNKLIIKEQEKMRLEAEQVVAEEPAVDAPVTVIEPFPTQA